MFRIIGLFLLSFTFESTHAAVDLKSFFDLLKIEVKQNPEQAEVVDELAGLEGFEKLTKKYCKNIKERKEKEKKNCVLMLAKGLEVQKESLTEFTKNTIEGLPVFDQLDLETDCREADKKIDSSFEIICDEKFYFNYMADNEADADLVTLISKCSQEDGKEKQLDCMSKKVENFKPDQNVIEKEALVAELKTKYCSDEVSKKQQKCVDDYKDDLKSLARMFQSIDEVSMLGNAMDSSSCQDKFVGKSDIDECIDFVFYQVMADNDAEYMKAFAACSKSPQKEKSNCIKTAMTAGDFNKDSDKIKGNFFEKFCTDEKLEKEKKKCKDEFLSNIDSLKNNLSERSYPPLSKFDLTYYDQTCGSRKKELGDNCRELYLMDYSVGQADTASFSKVINDCAKERKKDRPNCIELTISENVGGEIKAPGGIGILIKRLDIAKARYCDGKDNEACLKKVIENVEKWSKKGHFPGVAYNFCTIPEAKNSYSSSSTSFKNNYSSQLVNTSSAKDMCFNDTTLSFIIPKVDDESGWLSKDNYEYALENCEKDPAIFLAQYPDLKDSYTKKADRQQSRSDKRAAKGKEGEGFFSKIGNTLGLGTGDSDYMVCLERTLAGKKPTDPEFKVDTVPEEPPTTIMATSSTCDVLYDIYLSEITWAEGNTLNDVVVERDKLEKMTTLCRENYTPRYNQVMITQAGNQIIDEDSEFTSSEIVVRNGELCSAHAGTFNLMQTKDDTKVYLKDLKALCIEMSASGTGDYCKAFEQGSEAYQNCKKSIKTAATNKAFEIGPCTEDALVPKVQEKCSQYVGNVSAYEDCMKSIKSACVAGTVGKELLRNVASELTKLPGPVGVIASIGLDASACVPPGMFKGRAKLDTGTYVEAGAIAYHCNWSAGQGTTRAISAAKAMCDERVKKLCGKEELPADNHICASSVSQAVGACYKIGDSKTVSNADCLNSRSALQKAQKEAKESAKGFDQKEYDELRKIFFDTEGTFDGDNTKKDRYVELHLQNYSIDGFKLVDGEKEKASNGIQMANLHKKVLEDHASNICKQARENNTSQTQLTDEQRTEFRNCAAAVDWTSGLKQADNKFRLTDTAKDPDRSAEAGLCLAGVGLSYLGMINPQIAEYGNAALGMVNCMRQGPNSRQRRTCRNYRETGFSHTETLDGETSTGVSVDPCTSDDMRIRRGERDSCLIEGMGSLLADKLGLSENGTKVFNAAIGGAADMRKCVALPKPEFTSGMCAVGGEKEDRTACGAERDKRNDKTGCMLRAGLGVMSGLFGDNEEAKLMLDLAGAGLNCIGKTNTPAKKDLTQCLAFGAFNAITANIKNETVREILTVAQNVGAAAIAMKECTKSATEATGNSSIDKGACIAGALTGLIPGDAGAYLGFALQGFHLIPKIYRADSCPSSRLMGASALVSLGGDFATYMKQSSGNKSLNAKIKDKEGNADNYKKRWGTYPKGYDPQVEAYNTQIQSQQLAYDIQKLKLPFLITSTALSVTAQVITYIEYAAAVSACYGGPQAVVTAATCTAAGAGEPVTPWCPAEKMSFKFGADEGVIAACAGDAFQPGAFLSMLSGVAMNAAAVAAASQGVDDPEGSSNDNNRSSASSVDPDSVVNENTPQYNTESSGQSTESPSTPPDQGFYNPAQVDKQIYDYYDRFKPRPKKYTPEENKKFVQNLISLKDSKDMQVIFKIIEESTSEIDAMINYKEYHSYNAKNTNRSTSIYEYEAFKQKLAADGVDFNFKETIATLKESLGQVKLISDATARDESKPDIEGALVGTAESVFTGSESYQPGSPMSYASDIVFLIISKAFDERTDDFAGKRTLLFVLRKVTQILMCAAGVEINVAMSSTPGKIAVALYSGYTNGKVIEESVNGLKAMKDLLNQTKKTRQDFIDGKVQDNPAEATSYIEFDEFNEYLKKPFDMMFESAYASNQGTKTYICLDVKGNINHKCECAKSKFGCARPFPKSHLEDPALRSASQAFGDKEFKPILQSVGYLSQNVTNVFSGSQAIEDIDIEKMKFITDRMQNASNKLLEQMNNKRIASGQKPLDLTNGHKLMENKYTSLFPPQLKKALDNNKININDLKSEMRQLKKPGKGKGTSSTRSGLAHSGSSSSGFENSNSAQSETPSTGLITDQLKKVDKDLLSDKEKEELDKKELAAKEAQKLANVMNSKYDFDAVEKANNRDLASDKTPVYVKESDLFGIISNRYKEVYKEPAPAASKKL